MKENSSALSYAAAALLVLGIYIGLYAWLCIPQRKWVVGLFRPAYYRTLDLQHKAATYKYGGRVAAIFFIPAQKIDQLLFPARWDNHSISDWKKPNFGSAHAP